MHRTSLRKVGGSVMLAVPPALLEVLKLSAGAKVGLAVDQGRLVVEPETSPKYDLGDLLAQCDFSVEPDAEERAWLASAPAGREAI